MPAFGEEIWMLMDIISSQVTLIVDLVITNTETH